MSKMEKQSDDAPKEADREKGHLKSISELLGKPITVDELDQLFQRAEDISTWSFWPLENNQRPQW